MTPLAQKIARELTLPLKQRTFNHKKVVELLKEDAHCFDITAIAGHILDAMDETNVWPEAATMLPDLFLPSPVTWLEFVAEGKRRAYVLHRDDDWFCVSVVMDGKPQYGVDFGRFRHCSILESPDRIKLELLEIPDEPERADHAATAIYRIDQDALAGLDALRCDAREGDPFLTEKLDTVRRHESLLRLKMNKLESNLRDAELHRSLIGVANHLIVFSILALDLINTPGTVGFHQHAPHAGLAKQFARGNIGRYPLRGWSEVTVKAHTTFVDGEYQTGPAFHKCLHFVRSHNRRYRDGTVSVVRAHWRGDPALGIKRTRYRVVA